MDVHWVAHMGTMKGTQLIYMDWEGCLASYGNSKVCPGILWTLGSFPGLIWTLGKVPRLIYMGTVHGVWAHWIATQWSSQPAC